MLTRKEPARDLKHKDIYSAKEHKGMPRLKLKDIYFGKIDGYNEFL